MELFNKVNLIKLLAETLSKLVGIALVGIWDNILQTSRKRKHASVDDKSIIKPEIVVVRN